MTISKLETMNSQLTPAIIQHAQTNQVLMLGYMNEESMEKTKAEGKVTFFSRSKNRLWTKGETSGNFLNVVSIQEDCDNDTYLIKVIPEGDTCHKGTYTCFGEKEPAGFLHELQGVIQSRKDNPSEKSYTNELFQKGIKKIAQKVGEEATEVILEAMDNKKDLLIEESSDLLYHFLVLLADQGLKLEDVEAKLMERHLKK
ncbi:bifunctional phosphoribosyl-AMP cyclohydrolase/phosphoribosyl-ATP diphosphatase HisIE [Ekhidna sp.]|uniref:bifunctional phosphoribosyl-AMP cyclohydrolase/phosphoribosyl-ATP diphosphatase HisIE n=1 Tax=Ekhidna sp. TaxID=2608089 RepID=UPI003BAB8B31